MLQFGQIAEHGRKRVPDATGIPALEVAPSEDDAFLLAIEVQSEPDPDKPLDWACHVARLHLMYELPILLLVVCRNRTTATWAAGPFESRFGTWTFQVLRPLVLGPDDLPEIMDASSIAQQPVLATLAAITHSEGEKITDALEALARGMRSLDRDTALYLCRLLEVGLGDTAARETWIRLLTAGVL